MKRAELVKVLEAVQPALAANALVPVYTCYMFRNNSITAFNDVLGIVAKLPTDAFHKEFAVDGRTLLGLLQNSHAEEAQFEVTEDDVIMTAGKSNVKMPYFDEREFLFEEPDVKKWDATLPINDDLLLGIEVCLTTSSKDLSQPAIMGICFNLEGKAHALYSCDGDAITRYIPKHTIGSGIYTVPNTFCDELLKIAKEAKKGNLQINKDWAKATLDNGFVLYGRIIVNETPLNHQKMIDDSLKDVKSFAALPLGLHDALARARVLADVESKPTHINVEEGKMRLFTSTAMGDLRDELKIKGHPDIKADVHASLMHRSLQYCDQLSITERVTAYCLDNVITQVVGNLGK